jgi:predicted nucleotidyltransferase
MAFNGEDLPEALKKKGIAEKLLDICLRNDVVFMAIFGSYVRGEQHRGSDVDIAIECDENKPKSLLDLIGLENELSAVFGKKVDLGLFRSLHPYIIEDVKKEMHVLYDKRQE